MLHGRGWSVRPDSRSEVKRESYGSERNDGPKENVGDPNATFWTLCPYCWNLYEFYKIYQDCCLRCHNCNSPFHGVAVKTPPSEAIVEGKGEYYCCYGYFRIRYPDSQEAMPEKQREIRDEAENSCGTEKQERGFVAKEGGAALKANVEVLGEEHERVKQGSGGTELHGNGKRKMKYKTVVRSAKKKWGNRMYRRDDTWTEMEETELHLDAGIGKDDNARREGTEAGIAKDCDQGDLEFVEGDGDILVGIRYS